MATATTTARIKVQANNNIFFDISNSNFSIAAAVVPVTITNLKAYQKNSGLQVEWNTQNEINLSNYEVEKSIDGASFAKVGNVIAVGSSNYNWYDANATKGNNYYRLKMVEKDGSFKYSHVVNVKIGGGKNVFTVAGNPIKNNQILLQLEQVDKGNYVATLYNSIGQMMATKTIIHAGGSASETIQLKKVAAGNYQLRIVGSNGIVVTKSLVIE